MHVASKQVGPDRFPVPDDAGSCQLAASGVFLPLK
jgi:hypothetical protein